LRIFQFFIFGTEKSNIFLPPLPPSEKYTAVNQLIKWIRLYSGGGDGVLKKSFLGFQKINFENSAFCGILKILFLRTKKEQFISTISTTQNVIVLIISIVLLL